MRMIEKITGRWAWNTPRMWVMVVWLFVVAWAVLLLSQAVFAWLNGDLFSVDASDRWLLVVGNMKFAASAVAMCMWPTLLVAAAVGVIGRGQWAVRTVYGMSMALMLAANVIDTSYYRWTFRRMTWDIFQYTSSNFSGGWGALVVQFARDFWPYFLLFFALLGLTVWVASWVRYVADGNKRYVWWMQVVVLLLVGSSNVLCQRGGIVHQHKPLKVVDANRYAQGGNTALVLNTPFSIFRTHGHTGHLTAAVFFDSEEALDGVFTPRHEPDSMAACMAVSAGAPNEGGSRYAVGAGSRPNVVLIILESFGEEYLGSANGTGRGWTPFLDSLADYATLVRGLANGKRSIESVPSLLSGIPSLMEEAYITSPYSQNRVVSLPEMLKRWGYSTAFFHGAYNGSMNFDSYVCSIGIEHYYGMNEYNNRSVNPLGAAEGDFDGTWGIFDEPFLTFAARRITADWKASASQRVFATLYTISSHHPYTIPPQYKGRFPKGPQPILESVGYADHALRGFFAEASQQPWYENTIFVITADHASQPIEERYRVGVGQYAVPMIFYWPGHTVWVPEAHINAKGTGLVCGRTMQHADLFPTMVDMLALPEACYAFGRSLYDRESSFHMVYTGNGIYQFARQGRVISFAPQSDGEPEGDSIAVADGWMARAVLQQYTQRMIDNRLTDR